MDLGVPLSREGGRLPSLEIERRLWEPLSPSHNGMQLHAACWIIYVSVDSIIGHEQFESQGALLDRHQRGQRISPRIRQNPCFDMYEQG
jgi:hypothetical protein